MQVDVDAGSRREHGNKVHTKFPLTCKIMETRYYEGCGREGPIRCIFLGEFHPIAGPKISCQFPEDYVSKELFDGISAYIIPKPQIQKCTMTINALGHKIVGYPIRIDSSRYERNMYLFNLCFVCDSWSKTVQYEPVVKKLGEHLTLMEEESGYVSRCSSKLPTLLAHLLHDLNTFRKATLVEGDTVMHLKVLEVRKDPAPVHDCDVPVLVASVGLPRPGRPPRVEPGEGENTQSQEHLDVEDEEPFEVDLDSDWDLTTRQLLPYINGYNHVSKIASDTNVEKTLVKSCIQNLVYYGVVTLLPVLKFSNMYRATPKLSRLFSDLELQKSCLSFIHNGSDTKEKPSISLVAGVLCALQQGSTLRAVCERVAGAAQFDVRRLVVFAQIHGLVKCLRRYPVYVRNPSRPHGLRAGAGAASGATSVVRRLFTGRHSADEICCLARVDMPTLDQIIDEDPNVAVIWR
ncbi:GATOR complex protein NPRL2-like isoform X1 [Maniola hyperantus]|uniref:GATOR complex protein NPRL2-like isoform X1 n=1 Tax=Aphantopus hyperantus TaxID=2795564 RepID=UPI001567C800|nr:GATOR complex protein NPRL2-like isoform X1 [Maniola hyperantus]